MDDAAAPVFRRPAKIVMETTSLMIIGIIAGTLHPSLSPAHPFTPCLPASHPFCLPLSRSSSSPYPFHTLYAPPSITPFSSFLHTHPFHTLYPSSHAPFPSPLPIPLPYPLPLPPIPLPGPPPSTSGPGADEDWPGDPQLSQASTSTGRSSGTRLDN